MPRTRKKEVVRNSLSLDDFAKGLGKKNNELLEGMLVGLQNGELDIELKMISALFVVMLSEELLSEDLDDNDDAPVRGAKSRAANDDHDGHDRPGNKDFHELTIEVLRTVRAVWGMRDNKR